jgi:hypothetical protein
MAYFFRKWLESLNEAERDLRGRGYITVYGGATSFVICTKPADREPACRIGRSGGLLRQALGE